MVQRRGGARFLLEAPQAIRIGGERRGQNLDRHVTVESGVARPIDLAHTAGTDRGDDFVVIETRPLDEAHSPGIISFAAYLFIGSEPVAIMFLISVSVPAICGGERRRAASTARFPASVRNPPSGSRSSASFAHM